MGIEAFIYKLQGDMNTKRSKCVNATFDALSQGQESVSKAEFSNRYKGENGVEWREMIGNANGVTRAGFIAFYRGISSSITDDNIFLHYVEADWTLPNQRILPPFVEIRKVKVVHKDGRETVEEIEWDPAMGSDALAMKSSLLAMGISADTVTLL